MENDEKKFEFINRANNRVNFHNEKETKCKECKNKITTWFWAGLTYIQGICNKCGKENQILIR